MAAVISSCGKYRYRLDRLLAGTGDNRRCVFVMLNPSTADAEKDDPTIRRCKTFARRFGCNLLTVVNLYAFRSPSPGILARADDPEGPENARYVEIACEHADVLVAAWGASLPIVDSAALDVVRQYAPKCLGKTKMGHPRHPLYVRADEPLIPYFWPSQLHSEDPCLTNP